MTRNEHYRKALREKAWRLAAIINYDAPKVIILNEIGLILRDALSFADSLEEVGTIMSCLAGYTRKASGFCQNMACDSSAAENKSLCEVHEREYAEEIEAMEGEDENGEDLGAAH